MTSLVPQSFIPGYRLQSGTDLNVALANPQWSTSMTFEATTGGTAATSAKIVNTLTNITSATVNAGVTVPRAAIGRMLYIINSSGNTVKVYPEGDATINGLSSYSLPTNQAITLYGVDTTSWQVDNSGGGGGTVYTSPTNIEAFGAVGDAQIVNAPGPTTNAVSIASGTNTLTVIGAGFAPGDVGKTICVYGAGAFVSSISVNQQLVTTISGYISSTQVTLAANAVATLTSATKMVIWGTDNTAAIQNAANSSLSAVYVPKGAYLITAGIVLQPGQAIFGDGYNSNIIQVTPTKSVIRTKDSCKVSNLHLTNAESINAQGDDYYPAAVTIRKASNVIVENNWIEGGDHGVCGVFLFEGNNNTVKNNIIYGNKWSSVVAGFAAGGSDIATYGLLYRTIFDGNFCLSNTSQGISIAPNGNEADYVVSNNVCITLDPATCYPGGTWSEVANGGVRRHGIISQYITSTVNGPRAVVVSNLVRNTTWAGIYHTHDTIGTGFALIANNMISRVGYDISGTTGRGGIAVGMGGSILITGNMVDEYQGQFGGIHVYSFSALVTPASVETTLKISNNVVKNSAIARGIHVDTYASDVLIENNTCVNNALEDIYVALQTGIVDVGANKIIGNTIKRPVGTTSLYPGIRCLNYASERVTTIQNNFITGGDTTTSNTNLNAGIHLSNPCQYYAVIGNNIANFYHGIFYSLPATASQRNVVIQNNSIRDCNSGIYLLGSTSGITVPLVNNTFSNVTTPNGGGTSTAGRISQRLGDTLICDPTSSSLALTNGIPTRGDWLAGDKIFVTAPTAGNYVGAVCVTSGAPGTWQKFGAVTLTGNATAFAPTINAGTSTTQDITVTGAAVNDIVSYISFTQDLQGLVVTAWVQATNTVRVRLQNLTAGNITLTSGTLTVNVIKP